MSRTLSGLFLIGALSRPRKRKRTNRENPRTIPEQIGKIAENSGKSQKGQKRTKKEGQVQIGKPPRLKPPRLAALEAFERLHSTIRLRRFDAMFRKHFPRRYVLTLLWASRQMLKIRFTQVMLTLRKNGVMPMKIHWGTGGILFREYCFGGENSLSSAANSVSSARNSVSSSLHTNNRLKGTH